VTVRDAATDIWILVAFVGSLWFGYHFRGRPGMTIWKVKTGSPDERRIGKLPYRVDN